MKTLKIGAVVRLKNEPTKWFADHADKVFGYPQNFPTKCSPKFFKDIGGVPPIEEELSEYFICRYSYERGLPMDGIVVGYSDQEVPDYYLVWFANELGQDLTYIDPKDLITL